MSYTKRRGHQSDTTSARALTKPSISGRIDREAAFYMKLKIFRWIIVVVLVIGAFVLGIEFQKFTEPDSCLDMGGNKGIGNHQICISTDHDYSKLKTVVKVHNNHMQT